MKKDIVGVLASAFLLSACNGDDHATVANHNITKAADNFEIQRRIVFYNGITGEYMLSIEGLCSIDTSSSGKTLHVLCKTGRSEFKKHFLGISDNVTFFSEQMGSVKANMYHYRVNFKPQSILPDVRFQGSGEALRDAIIGE